MARKPLLWQLYPILLGVMVLALLSVTWYANRTYKKLYLDQVAGDLEVSAQLIGEYLRPQLTDLNTETLNPLCRRLGEQIGQRITLIAPDGVVLADTEEYPVRMDNHRDRPEIQKSLMGQAATAIRFSTTLRESRMYVALPVMQGKAVQVIVRTSVSIGRIEKTQSRFYMHIILGAIVVAFLVGVLIYIVWRRLSRPLVDIQKGAEQFARGELATPLLIPDSPEIGEVARAMNKMATDLSERIRTISDQRQDLQTIMSSMGEGVIAVDRELMVQNINQAACAMFDIPLNGFQDKHLMEVIRNAELEKCILETMEKECGQERDVEVLGAVKHLKLQSTLWEDSAGNITGVVVMVADVSRLRRLENVRQDFVANVSHELKTPITSIKGYVETLQDGALENPEETKKFLDIISRHTGRLIHIIEDLLTLSRIELEEQKGAIQCHLTRVRKVMESALQICQYQAEKNKIELELHCAEDFQANINPELIEQAVVNLVDNAMKFCDSGKVVKMSLTKDDSHFKVQVEDQGCGIAREHQGRLFERFYRVDKARSRKMGGTGLGLAIVKHIISLHGGTVGVKSQLGKGSIFSLNVPL